MSEDTKLILQELSGIRTELHEEISELREEIRSVRQELQKEIQSVRQELHEEIMEVKESFEQKIQSIQLTLDNEIHHNICIIAENHLDLSRKLSESLKAGQEQEVFQIRLNHLENEVRRIKEHVKIA